MLGDDRSPAAIINVFPSLPIHSSVLVALMAGLFLAALIVRAQRLPSEPSADPMMQRFSDRAARTAGRRAQVRARGRETRAERRARMTVTTTRDHARVAERSGNEHGEHPGKPGRRSSASPARRSGGYRIRWGRTLVALIGFLALITAGTTGALAALTALPGVVPLTAGGVLLLSLVTLRSMAVVRRRRRRRQRLDMAMAEAMNPAVEVAAARPPGVPSTAGASHQPSPGARAEEVRGRDSRQDEARQSEVREVAAADPSEDLDEDGLPADIAETFSQPESPSSGDSDEEAAAHEPVGPAASAAPGPGRTAGATWHPRAVPRPQYLEAEKAERAQPEPLIPEEPRPSSEFTLREDLPRGTVSPVDPGHQERPEQREAQALSGTGTDGAAPPSSDHSGPGGVQQSLDLDAVLKRRRA